MSTRRAVWVECDHPDGCEAQYPGDLSCSTAADARADAKARGWKRRNGLDLCREHAAVDAPSSPGDKEGMDT